MRPRHATDQPWIRHDGNACIVADRLAIDIARLQRMVTPWMDRIRVLSPGSSLYDMFDGPTVNRDAVRQACRVKQPA